MLLVVVFSIVISIVLDAHCRKRIYAEDVDSKAAE